MARERAGQLVLAERFEEAGGGQVAGAAVALGQRPVGDLADEGLDEAVHAPLRRARVDLLGDQLGLGQVAQPGLEPDGLLAGDGGQTLEGE